MTRLIAIAVAAALSACASGPGNYDPSKLTPAQIGAQVRDKSDTISCGFATYLTGRVKSIYVNLDKGASVNATVEIVGECDASITLTGPAKAASAP